MCVWAHGRAWKRWGSSFAHWWRAEWTRRCGPPFRNLLAPIWEEGPYEEVMALLAERGLGQVRGKFFDNGQELVFVKFAYSVLPKEAKDSLKEMGVPSWSFGPPKAEARDCLQPRHGVVFLSRAVSRFEAKLCLPASLFPMWLAGSFAARRRRSRSRLLLQRGWESACSKRRVKNRRGRLELFFSALKVTGFAEPLFTGKCTFAS